MSATYATTTDLTNRVGSSKAAELTAESGAADTTKLQAALDEAQGTIDSYLAKRYKTPIDLSLYPQAADILQARLLDIASWRLFGLRQVIPEDVRLAYEAAIRWLQDLSTGKANLPTTTPPAGQVSEQGFSFTSETAVCSRDDMGSL